MTIGSIIAWGSDTIPNGFLLCDGSAVSRTTYADLFSVIGTNFGTGDGSTTFNLPDLRGRVGVGKSSDTEFDTLGETGGEKTQALRALIGAVNNDSSAIGYKAETAVSGSGVGGPLAYTYGITGTGTSITVVNHSTRVTNSDGGSPSTLQPYLVTNYIIKALSEGTVKISELDSATSIDGTEVLPIVQSGSTKKVTVSNLLKDVYSTNEILTNKVWIDGKPIYRKVIEAGVITEQSATQTFELLSNVDVLIDANAFTETTNHKRLLPLIGSASTLYIDWDVDKQTHILTLNTQRDGTVPYAYANIVCIVEYTKTTD